MSLENFKEPHEYWFEQKSSTKNNREKCQPDKSTEGHF